MNGDIPRSTVRMGGHPILLVLASFPIACFSCALATDIAYARTADMMWADFSAWLLAVGILMGALAAIVGLVALIGRRRGSARAPALPVATGSLVVLILAFFDNLVHSRDAWTSVVPTGLALSLVTVIVMLITVWIAAARRDDRVIVMPAAGARR